jgi:ankyrin repeat protein
VDAVLSRFSSPEYANCRSGEGDTPLHYAARFGNVIALRRLEDTYGNHLDWHAVNKKGWTALDEAESREFQDVSDLGRLAKALFHQRTKQIVAYLLEKGVKRGGKGVRLETQT